MFKVLLYVFALIFLAIMLYIIITINSFKKAKNDVRVAYRKMDVYMKKKWDLIPTLIEIVKPYSKHQLTTLESVIRLRNTTYDNMSKEKKIKTIDELDYRARKLLSTSKDNSSLSEKENYKKLVHNLEMANKEILDAKIHYNECVEKLNLRVHKFPSNIIAKILDIKEEVSFEIHEFENK